MQVWAYKVTKITISNKYIDKNFNNHCDNQDLWQNEQSNCFEKKNNY